MAEVQTQGIESLRVSNLESEVNDEVNEMVKLVAAGNTLTDSQSSRLVAYLGNLEEMRQQLAIMIQYYENDDKVLKRLLALFDSIVSALTMIDNAKKGYSEEELYAGDGGDEAGSGEDQVVVADGDVNTNGVVNQTQGVNCLPLSPLSNSLVVASVSMLAVSGLVGDGADVKEAISSDSEADNDNEGNPWETPLTKEEIASLIQLENELGNASSSQPTPTDLRASVMMASLEDLVKDLEDIALVEWVAATPAQQQQHQLASSSSASSSSSSSSSSKGKQKELTCNPVDCKICYETFTLLSELHTLTCGHTYCVECLGSLLKVLIESGGVLDLCCPQPGCGIEIQVTDIAKLTDQATFAKYEKFVVLAALRTDPNVRWCPLPTCSSPVKGPPTDNTDWLVCNACGMNICFKCGDERHDPATCGKEAHELLARRHSHMHEAQAAFLDWRSRMKDEVKQCPGCKGFIEKNKGCNHMTCKACKFQFCWLCGCKYENGHYSVIGSDCNGKQYWTPPVPVDPELQKKYQWIYFPDTYQYADVDRAAAASSHARQETRRKAKKIGVYVGVGIAVATLGVPAAIIGGPIYGVFKLHKRLKAKKLARMSVLRTLNEEIVLRVV